MNRFWQLLMNRCRDRTQGCYLQARFILLSVLGVGLLGVSPSFGNNFLCRPWSNIVTGAEIGDSFTLDIRDGIIAFRGEEKPVPFAQLIYSHPLNDIFVAASGEVVTAGIDGQRIRVNVYFPNRDAKFFVTASCSRV